MTTPPAAAPTTPGTAAGQTDPSGTYLWNGSAWVQGTAAGQTDPSGYTFDGSTWAPTPGSTADAASAATSSASPTPAPAPSAPGSTAGQTDPSGQWIWTGTYWAPVTQPAPAAASPVAPMVLPTVPATPDQPGTPVPAVPAAYTPVSAPSQQQMASANPLLVQAYQAAAQADGALGGHAQASPAETPAIAEIRRVSAELIARIEHHAPWLIGLIGA